MLFFNYRKITGFFQCKKFLRLLLVLFAFSILSPIEIKAEAFEILLGTGEYGSFSHFAGRTLCRTVGGHADNISCKPVPTSGGDVHNLTNVRGGALDCCLIDSRMLHDALNKKGDFEFLDIGYENLLVLVPLYEKPISLLVREDANIETLDEIKGKRINAGAPLSVENRTMKAIMEAKNWTREDFSLVQELPSSQSQDVMAFCHGDIQAMIHIGVHPDASLQTLFKNCKADLIGVFDPEIENWMENHPAFVKTSLDPGVYLLQSEKIVTMGTQAMLVASDILDKETVFQILEAIYGGGESLQRAHPNLAPPPKSEALREAGVRFHPGAIEFFSARTGQGR